MEIPNIEIPNIKIPQVYVPQVFLPPTDRAPEVQTIGCKYFHRDVKNTGNRNLLIDDPNGVVSNCPYPSFIPMNFQPDQLIIVEEAAVVNDEPTKLLEGKPPQAEIPNEDKKEELFKPCPPKNAPFRQGDFKNELRLERLLKWERGIDNSCNAVWEKVPFIDQYIPQPSIIVSTAVIATVAATTPIILNLVKPIVKNLIKKLTKKKDKST